MGENGRISVVLVADYGTIARVFEFAACICLLGNLDVCMDKVVRMPLNSGSWLFQGRREWLLLDMVTYRARWATVHLILGYVDRMKRVGVLWFVLRSVLGLFVHFPVARHGVLLMYEGAR